MGEIGQGMKFVDRGDPSSADFTQATIYMDGAAHDLNLSNIIPLGAKAVLFRVSLNDDETGTLLYFYKKGNTNSFNISVIRTIVAGLWHDRDGIVAVSSDRKISYYGSNRVVDGITFVVKGWWI